MLDMILGLTLGAIACFAVCLAVHKMIEYGKRHGIVQTEQKSDSDIE